MILRLFVCTFQYFTRRITIGRCNKGQLSAIFAGCLDKRYRQNSKITRALQDGPEAPREGTDYC